MIYDKPLEAYFISAVFLPFPNVTHYMVHEHCVGVSGAVKMSKDEVISLVESSGVPVYVWEWCYETGRFRVGKQVRCNLDYNQNKYLWINEKDSKTKDLKHLIKMEWFG